MQATRAVAAGRAAEEATRAVAARDEDIARREAAMAAATLAAEARSRDAARAESEAAAVQARAAELTVRNCVPLLCSGSPLTWRTGERGVSCA